MLSEVTVFRKVAQAYRDYGEGKGKASISRLVGPQDSTTMGAYLARFDERSVPWTVRYDELIVCLEGEFRLRVKDSLHVLEAGDVVWVPTGTELAYEGAESLVFIAIAPVDWRDKVPSVSS